MIPTVESTRAFGLGIVKMENKILQTAQEYAGITASFITAIIIVGLRAIKEKTGLIAAILDIIIAGLAAPTVVWLLWHDAPFFVYGLVSALVARYPDLVKEFVKKVVKK